MQGFFEQTLPLTNLAGTSSYARGFATRFRLSKDGRGRKARRWPRRLRRTGVTHAYLGARGFAAQVVESGRRETAHSKMERGEGRAQAEPGARQGQSSPVRLW